MIINTFISLEWISLRPRVNSQWEAAVENCSLDFHALVWSSVHWSNCARDVWGVRVRSLSVITCWSQCNRKGWRFVETSRGETRELKTGAFSARCDLQTYSCSPQQLRSPLNMLCFTAAARPTGCLLCRTIPRDTSCSPHPMQHSRLTVTFRFPDKPPSLQMFTSGARGVWKCKRCNDRDLIFRPWHFLLTARMKLWWEWPLLDTEQEVTVCS